jgi:aspartate/methionine/tyrosine aminotransferase
VLPRAKRLEPIRGFGIDRVAAAADAPQPSSGLGVLRLENLDTNLPLPRAAIEATIAGLERPESNSWLPFTGDLELRGAISEHLERRCGRRYDPEREIVVTCGGLEGILDVLLATVDPGDEVVTTDPAYAGLVNRVRLAEGVPRCIPLQVVDGEWRHDVDAVAAAVGPRTRALMLMSPSMPSGVVLSEGEWQAIAALCHERDLLLILDSAMEAILFDGRPLLHPVRLEGMAERTAIVGSMSKEYRMIGWRVGWIAGPEQLVTDAGWVHVYNTTVQVGLGRASATAVLRDPDSGLAETTAELERRRDAIFEALPGWPLVRPAGGWSLLLDTAALGVPPVDASRFLLEDAAVAATAMVGWGGPIAERYVRFVFSNATVDDLSSLGDRLAGTRLAEAAAAHGIRP